MQTLFFGKLQTILQPTQKGTSVTEHLGNRLGNSNLGLHRTSTANHVVKTTDASSTSTNIASAALSALDSFQITEHISELLSPACGMTEEEKTAYFQRILAKLKSGKKLTAEEMRFLQAEHPEFYPQAARVQAMREGLETRLKCCRSKEAAQTMFANAMDSVSDEDPMKEYLVAAYQTVMEDFKKSDAYKELPDTEEEARRTKRKPIVYDEAFHQVNQEQSAS